MSELGPWEVDLKLDAIFGALPVLFAIAIAITFTRDAGTAGLSALN